MKYTRVKYQDLIASRPEIEGPAVKVWGIRKDETIRINLVEMSGELKLHQHPDADHSLMLIEGRVLVQVGSEKFEMEKGDFVSIPAGVPHKYWSIEGKSMLVSMDAPYYRETISLE